MPCALRHEACQYEQLEESRFGVMEVWKMGMGRVVCGAVEITNWLCSGGPLAALGRIHKSDCERMQLQLLEA